MSVSLPSDASLAGKWRGHEIYVKPDLYTLRNQVFFMGEGFLVDAYAADWAMIQHECEVIYQTITHQQAKGNQNGLFGQSTQAVSGHSTQGQGGGGGISLPIPISPQQQQAQLLQYAAQHGLINSLGGLTYSAPTNIAAAEKSLEPLKTEGFKIGELIGWRGWRITPAGFLKSMSAEVIWAPGEPMHGKTKSKEEHNGVYAYKTAKDFLSNHENSGLEIYGSVYLWGDVIEHDIGYRAEYAEVKSLDYFLVKKAPMPIKELRERYGVAA